MSYREGRFWQPDVTVATVVVRAGQFLCVEETAQGRAVINQPAGHLEPDETLQQAAIRETLEETGWDIRLTGFIGAYQWKAETGRHYLRFAFCGEPLAFHAGRPLDTGILAAHWWDAATLKAEAARHRSPLVWQTVADYLAGQRYPLTLAQHLA